MEGLYHLLAENLKWPGIYRLLSSRQGFGRGCVI
jgi:hypothetical protein